MSGPKFDTAGDANGYLLGQGTAVAGQAQCVSQVQSAVAYVVHYYASSMPDIESWTLSAPGYVNKAAALSAALLAPSTGARVARVFARAESPAAAWACALVCVAGFLPRAGAILAPRVPYTTPDASQAGLLSCHNENEFIVKTAFIERNYQEYQSCRTRRRRDFSEFRFAVRPKFLHKMMHFVSDHPFRRLCPRAGKGGIAVGLTVGEGGGAWGAWGAAGCGAGRACGHGRAFSPGGGSPSHSPPAESP
jgi:hypothetical protein